MPPQPDFSPRGPATARPEERHFGASNPGHRPSSGGRRQPSDTTLSVTHPEADHLKPWIYLPYSPRWPRLPPGSCRKHRVHHPDRGLPPPASATRWRRPDLPPDAYHYTFTTDVSPSVLDKGVTGFSSSQENAVGLTEVWYRFGWKMSCAIRVTNVPMVRTDNLPARRQVTWPPANPCLVSATANLDSAKRLDKTIAFSAPTLDSHHSQPL